jgi:hypothetical protein
VLKQYKNSLLEIIAKRALDIGMFEGTEARYEKGETGFVIRLANTPLAFLIIDDPKSFHRFSYLYKRFVPGFATVRRDEFCGIARVREAFERWLDGEVSPYLEEQAVPDLWTEIAKEKALSAAADQTIAIQVSFTDDDYQHLADSLNEIKQYLIRTASLTEAQIELISSRLNYLLEASKRMGRKDLLILAMGVLVNIVIAASLPPDTARELLKIAGNVLAWLFPGQPALPQ